MDDTDFAILRAMGFQPYLPGVPPADARKPTRVAERIGLGAKAVRERIEAMEKSGVIAGYDAFPNLHLFPLAWTSFHFKLTDERMAGFLAAVRPLDGVVGHFTFLGGDVCIDLAYQDDAELRRRLQVLTSIAGASPWKFYDNDTPSPARPLSPLDWRILRELRHDALRPFADVATALKVTERTVRDRFDRMAEEGNLWVVPRVDYSKMPNFIPFGLLLSFAPGADPADAVRAAVADRTLYSWKPPSGEVGQLALFVKARTTAEVERMRLEVARTPGVASARVLIPTGVEGTASWLDEAVARKAAEPLVSPLGPATPRSGRN